MSDDPNSVDVGPFKCPRCGRENPTLLDRCACEIDEAAAAERRKKFCYVGAPAIFRLELACKQVNDAFGEHHGCYLVGSALQRPDWRDVDVRFIMDDEAFDREFPGTRKNRTWEFDPKWLLLTTSIARFLSDASGLPVDFQFQPQTHANERHKGPRDALGLRFVKEPV